MKENDKKDLFIVILVILAILVPLITYLIDSQKKVEENYKIVTDYNDFYTVSSCISRVIDYINSDNSDSLLLVVNDNYKKKNKIDIDNVKSIFNEVLDNSNFVPKKMYYFQNNDIKKFYVYGKNVIEDFDGIIEQKDIYFVVYLNIAKKTFSIEPYDGKIFLGGDNSE